jgi:DoxX-like protein
MDSNPRWMLWTGRVFSAIPVLLMLPGVAMNLARTPFALEGMKKFGWQESAMFTIAVLAILSVVLYVVPRTAVLGAIVMTGYFGGAIANHLRIGDPGWPLALICGILTWGGLYLRDARLRELLPLRRPLG